MKVRVSSVLPVGVDEVWAMMNTTTLREITRGFVVMEGDLPDNPQEGDVLRMKVRLFGVLPAYDYEMRIVRLDRAGGRLVSHEKGGLVRSWHHQISIERLTATTTRHTDEIEIDAGSATPLVWAFANVFYRVRQSRERQIAARRIIEAL